MTYIKEEIRLVINRWEFMDILHFGHSPKVFDGVDIALETFSLIYPKFKEGIFRLDHFDLHHELKDWDLFQYRDLLIQNMVNLQIIHPMGNNSSWYAINPKIVTYIRERDNTSPKLDNLTKN